MIGALRKSGTGIGLAFVLSGGSLVGCGSGPIIGFEQKRMELIAESSVLATTFEHGDGRFYERSGQAGIAFTPHIAAGTEGTVGTPTIEMGAIVGEYGDSVHCCGAGQVGMSYRVRVPASDFVRPVIGPRAGVVFGPSPKDDLPVSTYVGGLASLSLLAGMASLDFKVDAVIAHGETGFSYRDGHETVIPRGQIGISSDLCAIAGTDACRQPVARTRLVDLSEQFSYVTYAELSKLTPTDRRGVCKALGRALVADPWEAERVRKARGSCQAKGAGCGDAVFDPEATPMSRFLSSALAGSSGGVQVFLQAMVKENDQLEACLNRELAIERKARERQQTPERHAIYGVYPPEMRSAWRCDGGFVPLPGPIPTVERPDPVDYARCRNSALPTP